MSGLQHLTRDWAVSGAGVSLSKIQDMWPYLGHWRTMTRVHVLRLSSLVHVMSNQPCHRLWLSMSYTVDTGVTMLNMAALYS